MKVLALDPGGTTGWAYAEVFSGGWTTDLEDIQWSMQVGQIKGVCEPERAFKMRQLVAELEPDVVVVEDFVLFPNQQHSPKRDGTEPMRLIAMLDLMWWLEKQAGETPPEMVKQMAGERMVIEDSMLKEWGLWRTEKRQGGGPHAMDALRHLIVYIRKQHSLGAASGGRDRVR